MVDCKDCDACGVGGRAITPDMLMRMASGLEWDEVTANVISLLDPNINAGSVQASLPLIAEPGTSFRYSTGATAIGSEDPKPT